MKLIIDPGHGGGDPGGIANGYTEKFLTLPTALRLAELLDEYEPNMTRRQDMTLNSSTRAEIVKDKYDYCLSVHYNIGGGNARGIEVIHSKFSKAGEELAQHIARYLSEATELPIRRVFSKEKNKGQDYYYMNRLTGKTTTVIIEVLFLDNADDLQHLNIEKICQGIAAGFDAYMREKEQKPEPPKPEPPQPVLRRGDKGEAVKELQRLLGGLEVDGSFGPLTEAAVIEFQKANGLKVDGIAGPETWGALKARPPNAQRYEYYKVSQTHVVEVEPMALRIAVFDKPGHLIPLDNFVTSGYQWHLPDGETYPLGILVSKGVTINNWQPHNLPAGTFIVYKDGRVEVKELLTVDNERDIWFAVSGCSILPEIRMKSAGFVAPYDDIARATWRPVIGYNPNKRKAVIAVRPDSSIERGQLTLKNLGCDRGITLDGGGSTVLKVDGKLHKSTTRRLYSVITW